MKFGAVFGAYATLTFCQALVDLLLNHLDMGSIFPGSSVAVPKITQC